MTTSSEANLSILPHILHVRCTANVVLCYQRPGLNFKPKILLISKNFIMNRYSLVHCSLMALRQNCIGLQQCVSSMHVQTRTVHSVLTQACKLQHILIA